MKIGSLQTKVCEWVEAAFGSTVAANKVERNHRFLEESLELVQSLGCTQDEAHQLVDYVYGRPDGEANQEVEGLKAVHHPVDIGVDLALGDVFFRDLLARPVQQDGHPLQLFDIALDHSAKKAEAKGEQPVPDHPCLHYFEPFLPLYPDA